MAGLKKSNEEIFFVVANSFSGIFPLRSSTNSNNISSSFNQRIFVIVIPRVALGVRGNDGLLARLPTSYSREATRL